MTPLQTFLAQGNHIEEISFTDHDHRYFDPSKPHVKYTSCTTLIDKYKEKYDGDLWSMQTALKEKGYKVRVDKKAKTIAVNGIVHHLNQLKKNTLFKSWQDVVKAKWRATTEEACERGNQTHNYLENVINQSKGYRTDYGADNYQITASPLKGTISTVHDLDATNLKDVLPSVYNRLAKYVNANCSIFAEKRVRLDLVQLAGMIDVPIFINGTNKFCIVDWKTNKDELKVTPGYYKKAWVGGTLIKTDQWVSTDDTFEGILSHVPSSKFNTYALQLSIYAYILECWGYELIEGGLEIIHMRPNMAPKLVKIPYMKQEVELIMKDQLKELGIAYEVDVVIDDTKLFKRVIK